MPSIPGMTPEAGAMDRAEANPFEGDVRLSPLEIGEMASIEGLHGEVLDRLADAMENPEGGRLVLLTAPKAGMGKTHLLGRLAAMLKTVATVVPVSFRAGDPLTLATVCRRGMEALHQAAGERPGWTRLREVSGQVVAALMHRLIESGKVTCANPAQAQRVLAGPVEEIFDERGSASLIGDWLRQHRQRLCPPLTALASEKMVAPGGLSPVWMETLMEHAADGSAASLATLAKQALTDAAAGTPTWLKLAGMARPVVLLVDHLDGWHRDPQAGVTLAALLTDLADAYDMRVVLSVNQDVWQGAFGAHLPGALEDRLTAAPISLRGLTVDDAEALVKMRLERAGVETKEAEEFGAFLATERFFLGRPFGSVPARVFLRHAARQWEMFHHSVPSPVEGVEGADLATIPLMAESLPAGQPVTPTIFDEDTGGYVKEMAEGLAQPRSLAAAEGPTTSAEAVDWSQAPASEGGSVAPGMVTPSADAFVKLREMLGKLRQPSVAAEVSSEAAESFEGDAGMPGGGATESAATGGRVMTAEPRADALLGRFEALRLQMSAEADSQPLDFAKLGELIRLAGRRFPLVRFVEHELPGMTGRPVMGWSLQNVEILFGLANFSDASYWKTLGEFAAGRLAELKDEEATRAGPPVKLKVVTFKTDRENTAYQIMVTGEAMSEPVLESLDGIHLDAGSVASLYAMQRIIKEAETGALEVEPAQVMSALARELDFFWRRVTRPG